MNLTPRQHTLLDFVKKHHDGQTRKYTHEPYWTHVVAVAEIAHHHEPNSIEIALCHDLIEDTDCTHDELFEYLQTIGYTYDEACDIYDAVDDLTNKFTKERFPSANRKERKSREAARLGYIPPTAQSVKYADIIHNTQSIVANDPAFAATYVPEKIAILNHMRKGNIHLLMQCCYTLQTAMNSLKSNV